jgi:hypothetical protein
MKNRIKTILIGSSLSIAILIVAYYLFFRPADAYTYDCTTSTIQKGSVEYVPSKSLPSKFLDKREKTIGKIKGSTSTSAERWVVKIQGIDEREMFLVTGLMNVELFLRKDKLEEIYKTLLQ